MPAQASTVRIALAIGLLAIIPATVYGLDRALDAGVIAAINVVLIVLALLLLFGPPRSEETAHPG